MSSLIAVHPQFERHWPFVADHFHQRWSEDGETTLLRVAADEERALGEVHSDLRPFTRMVSLGVTVTARCFERLSSLREAALTGLYRREALNTEIRSLIEQRNIVLYSHTSEGFWGQSVSEFALALTICALRQIPQNYHNMMSSHEAWQRYSPQNNRGPQTLGAQFSDDINFTNGTVSGKRVRVIGMGNIGSRYASFTRMLGADVAAWDPYATEPHFHRAGVRKEWHLNELVQDAEIFAPMLPLTESTNGLVTEQLINALPTGCLVVLATRAKICNVDAIRQRVMLDEIALAADVFDVEPLPLDDPLLGRHNVVHTPHLAGRTRDANRQWADGLIQQFRPVQSTG